MRTLKMSRDTEGGPLVCRMQNSLFPRANRGFMREIGFSQGKAVLVALPLMLAAASRSLAQRTDRERSITDIVKASSPAVVLIVTFDASNNPVAQGSGFVISPDGRIATNHHVIEGADSAIVKICCRFSA